MIGSDFWFHAGHFLAWYGVFVSTGSCWIIHANFYTTCILDPYASQCDPVDGSVVGPIIMLGIYSLAYACQCVVLMRIVPLHQLVYTSQDMLSLCHQLWSLIYLIYPYVIMTWRSMEPFGVALYYCQIIACVCVALDLALVHYMLWMRNLHYDGYDPKTLPPPNQA